MGHRCIEHQMEAVAIIDTLLQRRTIHRNQEYSQSLRQIRLHIVEANAATCRSLFRGDTLSDLPPLRPAA